MIVYNGACIFDEKRHFLLWKCWL